VQEPLTMTLTTARGLKLDLSPGANKHPQLAVLLLTLSCACAPVQPRTPIEHSTPAQDIDAVIDVAPSAEPAPYFVRDGKPFCFSGFNNYYLMYKDRNAVTSVLNSAQHLGAQVIRTWAFLDRGALDGSVKDVHESGHKDGVYFQYWDPVLKRPAYNDGEDGLQRLDFIVHEARKRHLTLILPLTNNWRDFGGMDQYLTWYGLGQHHLFFSDERVRAAYKSWVEHVVSRVNSLDGVPYKDDPAIFAWELANEPRATNAGPMDAPGWTQHTVTAWAAEMSAFIKSLDSQHMVSVGDEGFLYDRGTHFAYSGTQGVDHEQLTALPFVDFGTFHLYPDHWNTSTSWGNQWIQDHISIARRLDKPIVLEEYGLQVTRSHGHWGDVVQGAQRRRNSYTNWHRLMAGLGGAGSLFWMLAGEESPGQMYPDYDHFVVHPGDDTFQLLQTFSASSGAARACELAGPTEPGSPSPFVQARGARRAASP